MFWYKVFKLLPNVTFILDSKSKSFLLWGPYYSEDNIIKQWKFRLLPGYHHHLCWRIFASAVVSTKRSVLSQLLLNNLHTIMWDTSRFKNSVVIKTAQLNKPTCCLCRKLTSYTNSVTLMTIPHWFFRKTWSFKEIPYSGIFFMNIKQIIEFCRSFH